MGAIVWLFSCMEPHVGLEMVVTCEPFVTNATLKRFLSCMGAFMVLQYMLVPERPVANLAREHLENETKKWSP